MIWVQRHAQKLQEALDNAIDPRMQQLIIKIKQIAL